MSCMDRLHAAFGSRLFSLQHGLENIHLAPQEACKQERTWKEQPPPQLLPVKHMDGYLSDVSFTHVCWKST